MKELLIIVLVLPVALLVVLNNRLSTFQMPAVAVSTPVAVPVGMPTPTVGTTPLGGILDVARSWLGSPYLWGGCTRRGVDCSCAVRNWWAALGINLPRTTSEQIRWAIPITREQIQPGDLLFFNNTCANCGPNPTHVGLALGGNLMIHAGDPVQISRWDNLQFAGAGRVHQ